MQALCRRRPLSRTLLPQPREHPRLHQPDLAPLLLGGPPSHLSAALYSLTCRPQTGPGTPPLQTHPIPNRALVLDLNHAPVHRWGQTTNVASPRPQSTCPRAPRRGRHLRSLPPQLPGRTRRDPTQKAFTAPTPQPGSYPTGSQGKCNQVSLAAALHLICIMPP